MAEEKKSSRADMSLIRLALRALLLLIVVPTCVVVYLFRDDLQGKSVALALLLLLAVIGFYIMWSVINAIRLVQQDLKAISEGKTTSIAPQSGMGQLTEMSEIIHALNQLTIEFRENASQLEKFINQFSALTELTEITASVPNIDDLLGMVLKKAMTSTNARVGTVMLLDDTGEELWIVATEGWSPTDGKSIPVRNSFAAQVIESGEPLRIEDIEKAETTKRKNNDERYSSPSFIIMPLKSKSKPIGVVSLSDKSTGAAFSPQDQQFLAVMLAQVGFAVENARLLQQARDAAYQLKQKVEDQDVQLQDAELKFSHVEKLSALGQLAGGVAHDFNNLILAILGYTRFAMEGLEEDDRRRSDLQEVIRAAERAAALTRQLLAFGRRQVLQPIDMNLNHVIEEMTKMLIHVIGEHIELEVNAGEKLGVIHADPAQLEQVLMNLCLNARDSMPEGGRLTITTSNVVISKAFCESCSWAKEGDYVCLAVSDTGRGMDEKVREKVFQPFFTTKGVGKGSGLGLSTVYGIVKQHGGLIDVESEPGKGSTFRIHFPIVGRPAQAMVPKPEGELVGGSETILVAEDEEIVASLTTRFLKEAGYNVLLATDGAQAVEVFGEHADEIDFALIDVVMPKMSGGEVCDRIRDIRPDIKIMFTSGYTETGNNSSLNLDRSIQIMTKPYEPQDLLHKLRELLDK